MIRFQDPQFLILLFCIPFLVYWFFKKQPRREGTLRFPHLGMIKKIGSKRPQRARIFILFLRTAAVILIILGLARPQSGSKEEEITTEGVDIVLALDISSSMLAEDFKPNNRLHVAKLVAADFLRGRISDRIGLVVFAGASFTQCPLTLDYGVVLKFLEQIEIGMVEDGTAIGMAIANCVNRLKESKAKS